jgi:hypothetical protein
VAVGQANDAGGVGEGDGAGGGGAGVGDGAGLPAAGVAGLSDPPHAGIVSAKKSAVALTLESRKDWAKLHSNFDVREMCALCAPRTSENDSGPQRSAIHLMERGAAGYVAAACFYSLIRR